MVSELADIPDHAGEDISTPLRIAPDRYVLDEGAIADLDRYLDSTDVDSAYVLAGERAAAAVGDDLDAAEELAAEFVDAGYNPGTTADITAAALFVALERGLEV